MQTQTYVPNDLWGFRMNSYFNYSIALLGNKKSGIKTTKAYTKIGIVVIINNDYLVASSFQIALAYYLIIPFKRENVFRSNAFETGDFGLQNSELVKPRTVLYK